MYLDKWVELAYENNVIYSVCMNFSSDDTNTYLEYM